MFGTLYIVPKSIFHARNALGFEVLQCVHCGRFFSYRSTI
jgi:hypothetical protein